MPRSKGGILENSRNFTVLIKNQIGFPKFSVGRTNILDTQNASYLAECVYSAATDPLCPVFRIGDMADAVGANWTELALYGGVIRWIILAGSGSESKVCWELKRSGKIRPELISFVSDPVYCSNDYLQEKFELIFKIF